ncbi:acylphosphatase [bacterium]|nr:acylphosphatase [bacterium]
MKRLYIKVFGIVQGVGFRFFVLHKARELNIAGFVRNLADGSVEIDAVGEPDDVEKFLIRVRKGPPIGNVSRIEVSPLEPGNEYLDFEIRF